MLNRTELRYILPQECKRFSSFPKRPHLPILLNGYSVALFPGEKEPCFEVDHSSASSARFKNQRIYSSSPLIYFHGIHGDVLLPFILCFGGIDVIW